MPGAACVRIEDLSPLPFPKAASPMDWPSERKIALLAVAGDKLSRDIVTRLRAEGARWAQQQDFAELRREGFIVKREVTSYHALTDIGRIVVSEIRRAYARQFDIHFIDYTGTAATHVAICSCGWRVTRARSMRDCLTFVARYAGQHIHQQKVQP